MWYTDSSTLQNQSAEVEDDTLKKNPVATITKHLLQQKFTANCCQALQLRSWPKNATVIFQDLGIVAVFALVW